MLEQGNGSWRAFDDSEHHNIHECKKSQSGPQNSGSSSSSTRTLDNTAPSTNTSTGTSPKGPDLLTQLLNSKDFEAKVRAIISDVVANHTEFANRGRVLARGEIEKMLKKAMAF